MYRRNSSHYRSSVQGENRVRWVIVVICIAAVLMLGLILGLYFGLRDDNTKLISVDGQVDLDLLFKDEYKDPTSDSYQQLQQDFCTEMQKLYDNEDLENCTIISVVQGSVRIRYLIVYNIQIDQEEGFLQEILSELQAVPQGRKPDLFKSLPILEQSIVLSITTDMVTGEQCKTSSVCSGADVNEAIESVFPTTETCSDNSCSNGGTCIETTSSVMCLCHGTGFGGNTCSDDIDECLEEPCLHNGNCTNSPSSFDCSCAVGFSGATCEADINECDNSPCNGGICSNNDGSFECHCDGTGYIGDVCSEDIDECTPENPCQNGATCSNSDGSFICVCVPGFTGELCETNINECEEVNCVNGTCTDLINSFNCICDDGYEGELCASDVNECDDDPCQNGGNCSNSEGSFVCECGPGFSGNLCEEDLDECMNLSPCSNGTCLNTVGSYTCICDDGYTGEECDENINECNNNPCFNGGICSDTRGSFTCDCTGTGYTGDVCGIDLDECMNLSPCSNGTCLNTVGSYTCICDDGYTGEECDENINECNNNPCFNGGICSDTRGSFTCDCTGTGYTGDVCGIASCEYREIHSCTDPQHFKSLCNAIGEPLEANQASDCFEMACNATQVNTINYVHDTTMCHFLECQDSLQLVITSSNTEIYIRQPDYVTQDIL